MNDKLKRLLGSLDQNQLAEINRFLNSDDGRRFKNKISDADKENLLRQVDGMNPAKLKRAFSNLTKDDLAKMLNQRK